MTTKTFPLDWPKSGLIDLEVHDLPHQSSTTEWWYINAHIEAEDGNKYSVFASFFRKLLEYDPETKSVKYGHSITWALIDNENKKYYSNSLLDKDSPKIGLKQLKGGRLIKNKEVREAAIEMLEKGSIPYPDRVFKKGAQISKDKLWLKFDDNTFLKKDDGKYELNLLDPEHGVSVFMEFEPTKAPVRHGDDGVVKGQSAETMFYYFIPRNNARGYLKIFDKEIHFSDASAWYDHEFGVRPEEEAGKSDSDFTEKLAWNWMSGQLSNGYEFTVYDLIDKENEKGSGACFVLIDPEGSVVKSNNFSLYPKGGVWTSTKTFNDYPLTWVLEVPSMDFYLEAQANFPNQEFITVISKTAFWEGALTINGELNGVPFQGPGFLERSGFSNSETLEDFLKIVSRETKRSVDFVIPRNPGPERLEQLISGEGRSQFVKGVDPVQFSKSLIEPIRSIVDRGGKSWRSYALLACCDLVGGDSQRIQKWLALPELLHVGSLIVDDVEDKSDIRRGKPSCHKIYGEPTAINAGSACYFIVQIIIYSEFLDPEIRLKVYNLFFEALRAAHAGQALDIHGLDYMMTDVVESDQGDLLLERITAIHRLKSAAPASYLAQIGAMVGGGTEEQILALGNYYEVLGVSFQIIDDTLNLKGFKDGLKTKGEDISAGKITYPIARAMKDLNQVDRKRLWEILQMKSSDLNLITEAVNILDKVCAIEKSEKIAFENLEEAWENLDPLVRDSGVKLNLRAFSSYVLNRHY
ncbi:polyprenyl synthetase family protein [Membranihabitans maritimus]|uniref:polyprenyl synthetase family protein n=1 Tax=Membranihabitans maritimus TaxID=2904244 RepID=UPI001F1DA9B3|nr:polyprenyl synthetase family protein [Membranihabitans maritimus]